MPFINKVLGAGVGLLAAVIIYKVVIQKPAAFVNIPSGSYDFIVVGGGSTGCVLAARLSENYTVLLVEAGGHFSWQAGIPLAAPFLQGTDNDWQFRTEPQEFSSYGLVDEVSYWPRGKGLGGSGQLNYMVHYGGKKEDWEDLARQGVQGWTLTTFAHYMAKLTGKSYRTEEIKTAPPDCAEDSVVTCSQNHCHINATRLFVNSRATDPTDKRPIVYATIKRLVRRDKTKIIIKREEPQTNYMLHALIGAAKELKHLRMTVSAGEGTIRNGWRWSSLQSHLEPAMNKNSKLNVLLNTKVTGVTFKAGRVTGVSLNESHIAATKEVIMCAGAVSTPHLLQLSGVGPKELLEKHGIKVVADLPVGFNLHDHFNVPLYVSLKAPVSMTISKVLRVSEVLKYALFGKGFFGRSGVAGTVISGDLGILLFGMGSTEEKLFRVISNYKSKVFNAVFPDNQNHSAEGMVLLASCLKPHSRGWVNLQSADPSEPPSIQPNYLFHQHDIQCTRQAIRLVRRLILTEPFKNLGAVLRLPILDECSEFEPSLTDDSYLDCLIRTIGITSYHPGGTVAMGNLTHSVLDSAFRVDKVSGLRVVDSSVFPSPLRGGPHSILLAMAERAANMIAAEAQDQTNS